MMTYSAYVLPCLVLLVSSTVESTVYTILLARIVLFRR